MVALGMVAAFALGVGVGPQIRASRHVVDVPVAAAAPVPATPVARVTPQVVRTPVKRVSWAAPTYAKIYVNKNHLLGEYPGADGVKTGWTTLAKHCLVASATRGGVRLIAVVLGSDDAYADARRLLDHGFRTRG